MRKERIPDLVVLALILIMLLAFQYFKIMHLLSDYPFVFLALMYFTGRSVTWYIISRHRDGE